MAKHKLTSLVASRLGNHRTRNDLMGQASFPGLTIDNLPAARLWEAEAARLEASRIASLRSAVVGAERTAAE